MEIIDIAKILFHSNPVSSIDIFKNIDTGYDSLDCTYKSGPIKSLETHIN